ALGGVVWRIDSHVVAPGVIRQAGKDTHLYIGGGKKGPSAWARRLSELFLDAGIGAEESADIRGEQWKKLCSIAALSGVSCVLRSSVGPIYRTPLARQLLIDALL